MGLKGCLAIITILQLTWGKKLNAGEGEHCGLTMFWLSFDRGQEVGEGGTGKNPERLGEGPGMDRNDRVDKP